MIIRLYFIMIPKLMMMEQISPGLQIPMWIPYLAVPIGCLLILIRTIQRVVLDLRQADHNEKEA